jgi:hypothetical protein
MRIHQIDDLRGNAVCRWFALRRGQVMRGVMRRNGPWSRDRRREWIARLVAGGTLRAA